MVIVTGGARGIGAAITRTFVAESAIVCIFGRNAEDAAQLVSDLEDAGPRAASFACELTDSATILTAVQAVRDRFGRIDVVVNNAGVNDGVGLASSEAEFRASLDRNLIHPFVLVQACLPELIKIRGNIGTKCAVTGQGNASGYAAAKGGLNALTREWALDLVAHGIRVNAVIPTEVMTPLYERWRAKRPDPAAALAQIEHSIPFEGRLTRATEIADTVAFTASPRASHTTGQILCVYGGYVYFDRAATPR
ncbi:MAG: SDR family oxidoreductase [Candidatus Synoicihabitans palmerolidicus]|nr:SDR family oxidoreductase [Candidatus Synoicihabitans palmerolidicus]